MDNFWLTIAEGTQMHMQHSIEAQLRSRGPEI